MTKRPTPNLTPLVEDASQSPFMRELLEAGRDSSVAGYDFEQGLSKHIALVEAGAPLPHWAEGLRPAAGTGGAGAGAAAAGSSLVAWLAVPLALVALTSAIVLVSRQSPRAPEVAPAAAPSAPVAVQPAAPAVVPEIVPAQVPPARTPAPSAAAPRTVRAKRPAAPVSSKAAQAPVAASNAAPAASAKSAAPRSSGELFATAQPAAAPAQPASTQPAAPKPEQQAVRPPAPEQPAPQDDARLEREMSMLAVAQRALQTAPERSLSLARQGEMEFAGSMFTQERQQVLLLALVKLGRMDEARRLAKPYLARYPHGPFSDRVRHALATGKVER